VGDRPAGFDEGIFNAVMEAIAGWHGLAVRVWVGFGCGDRNTDGSGVCFGVHTSKLWRKSAIVTSSDRQIS
jgi:hypothetical protein